MLRHRWRWTLTRLLHWGRTPLLPSMRRRRSSSPLMLWPLLSPVGTFLFSTLLSRRRHVLRRRTSPLLGRWWWGRTTPISIPVASIHSIRRRPSLSVHPHRWSTLPLRPSSSWSSSIWGRLLWRLLTLPSHVSPIWRHVSPRRLWSSVGWLLKVRLTPIGRPLVISRRWAAHASWLSCGWSGHPEIGDPRNQKESIGTKVREKNVLQFDLLSARRMMYGDGVRAGDNATLWFGESRADSESTDPEMRRNNNRCRGFYDFQVYRQIQRIDEKSPKFHAQNHFGSTNSLVLSHQS
jgi:hypothetical protein